QLEIRPSMDSQDIRTGAEPPSPFRFECRAEQDNIVLVVETDSTKHEVRLWFRFGPTVTDGPNETYRATIRPEIISWRDSTVAGTSANLPYYVYAIDRRRGALYIQLVRGWAIETPRRLLSCT